MPARRPPPAETWSTGTALNFGPNAPVNFASTTLHPHGYPRRGSRMATAQQSRGPLLRRVPSTFRAAVPLRHQPSERRDHAALESGTGLVRNADDQRRQPAPRDGVRVRPRRGLRVERRRDVRARRYLRNQPLRAIPELDVHQRIVPDVDLRPRRTVASQFVRRTCCQHARYEGIEISDPAHSPRATGVGYDARRIDPARLRVQLAAELLLRLHTDEEDAVQPVDVRHESQHRLGVRTIRSAKVRRQQGFGDDDRACRQSIGSVSSRIGGS